MLFPLRGQIYTPKMEVLAPRADVKNIMDLARASEGGRQQDSVPRSLLAEQPSKWECGPVTLGL